MSLIGRIKPGATVKFRHLATGQTTEKVPIHSRHLGCRTYGRIRYLGGGIYSYSTYDYEITVYEKGIVFLGPYAIAKPHVEDWDENRLDIIGQNGNDGLHYPTS